MLAIDGMKMSSMGILINFSNQNISEIPNLYDPNENMSSVSQTKCENMFSYLEVGSYIFTFS